MIRSSGGIHRTSRNAGRNADSTDLAAKSPGEGGCVRCVHRRQIGDLGRNNVVEYSESAVDRSPNGVLIRDRDAGLPNDERRSWKKILHVGLNDLAERLIYIVRDTQKGASRTGEESVLIDWIGIPRSTQPCHQCQPRRWPVTVHRIQVEVAVVDTFSQRHRKGLACRVCGPISELGQIVVDDGRHNALTQVVVADIYPAGIHPELEGVQTACPDEIVVDLPLRHVAALGIRIVVTTQSSERRIGRAARQHDGKGLLYLRKVVRFKDTSVPTCTWIELIDQIGREQVGVTEDERALRLRGERIKYFIDGIGPDCLYRLRKNAPPNKREIRKSRLPILLLKVPTLSCRRHP